MHCKPLLLPVLLASSIATAAPGSGLPLLGGGGNRLLPALTAAGPNPGGRLLAAPPRIAASDGARGSRMAMLRSIRDRDGRWIDTPRTTASRDAAPRAAVADRLPGLDGLRFDRAHASQGPQDGQRRLTIERSRSVDDGVIERHLTAHLDVDVSHEHRSLAVDREGDPRRTVKVEGARTLDADLSLRRDTRTDRQGATPGRLAFSLDGNREQSREMRNADGEQQSSSLDTERHVAFDTERPFDGRAYRLQVRQARDPARGEPVVRSFDSQDRRRD